MKLKQRAQQAATEVCNMPGEQLSDEGRRVIARIIEQAMQEAIREAANQSSAAAVSCCRHNTDMAHQIAEEIERANKALIANLSALR